jgi:hypothetical protein
VTARAQQGYDLDLVARQQMQDERRRLGRCRQFKVVFIKLHPHACLSGKA